MSSSYLYVRLPTRRFPRGSSTKFLCAFLIYLHPTPLPIPALCVASKMTYIRTKSPPNVLQSNSIYGQPYGYKTDLEHKIIIPTSFDDILSRYVRQRTAELLGCLTFGARIIFFFIFSTPCV